MTKQKPKIAKVEWKAKQKTVDYQSGYRAGLKAGVIKEREACASLCEATDQEYEPFVGTPKKLNYTCADAIRKRSNVNVRGRPTGELSTEKKA